MTSRGDTPGAPTPIYLDIETIPCQQPRMRDLHRKRHLDELTDIKPPANYKDPEKIQAYIERAHAQAENEYDSKYRKTALSGLWGEVVCISVAGAQHDPHSFFRATTEHSLLIEFLTWLNATQIKEHAITLIGHNIIGFDLPFLFHRSVINELRWPWWAPTPAKLKPWGTHGVEDTMILWSGRDYVKLTDLCAAFGIEAHPDEIDGGGIWDAMQAHEYDKIVNHCEADVLRVREVHRRLAA